MSSKPSSKGTKKKSTGDGNDATSESSTKTLKSSKLPKVFITRPSSQTSVKSFTKSYIHPLILQNLGIIPGGFVQLCKEGSNNGILAIAASLPEEEADGDNNVVQLSNSLRSVGNLILGDRLELKKHSAQPAYATSVVIGTLSGNLITDKSEKSIEKLLEDVGVITPGLILENVSCFVNTNDEDKVEESLIVVDVDGLPDVGKLSLKEEPQAASSLISCTLLFQRGCTKVQFTETTQVSSKYNIPQRTTYSQVGGLSKQIDLLKSTIELPLHKPTLFSSFGITPPRGILLHGPPGTGKTMLLRAVAQETQAHVLTINGPSIVSKYLGETEAALRDIFNEAIKYQPSIIFMDEIDSLAPSRNSDDSGEVESRVVAQLLTLMDGVGDSGRLVVVAATNRPNSIDAALRRPGRFDQEVEIGIPDVDARLDILTKQFTKMGKHNLTSEDIASIAGKTHGYVGADLVALCRESVMKTIQKALKSNINLTQFDDLKVSLTEVIDSMQEIRPSAMREIFLEMPKVYWSDIGGQDELKQKLKEMIQLPLEASETFNKLGVSSPKGVLLYGPPGCSKTLTAKALATESGVNFLAVKGPEIFNKYVGESEKAIREIFRKARAASPSIIFFDEIDALSSDRANGGGSTSASSNVLTSLLNEIDGVEELKGVVIVAATNRPDEIDPALLRPGRLDRHVFVGPPDFEARLQILINNTKKMNLDEQDVDLKHIAELTEGCSGAEVVLLAQEAGLAAIMEDLKCEQVHKRHFEKALSGISKGITEEMLEYYREFASRSGIEA
ncbi:hypothetical protein WICPIJ_006239 [Wickerhamomyces pijperi]|uniref:AAA+ ATPase domain-containing protein n=1 Tax=Wickerhamomyces pijperi TaxID=599730 RepID=A0A9P8Q4C3_WICPI|nr:hypothetical protein WICPIJ_006239 [Wickerhamomyces pijperi]